MPQTSNRPGSAEPRPINQNHAGGGISVSLRLPDRSDNRAGTFVPDLDHFRARVLQDALTEATAAYWIRRAEAFEAAAPRPGDWHGFAQADDLVDQAVRCRQIAENCRHHAQLIRESAPELISAAVLAALEEVA